MSAEKIKAEVRALRAGRGVYAVNLTTRMGTHLRELCVADATEPEDRSSLRRRLISELNGCALRLPPDVATAIRASLGIHGQATDAQFQGRVTWLARQLGREERTALRRIDEAEVLLAEEISRELSRRRANPQDGDWHVACLDVLVRLDTPTIEVYEERRIVAEHDGVDEFAVGVNLPSSQEAPSLSVRTEVRHGGRLVRRDNPLPRHSQLVVALPEPLRAGQSHDCGLLTRIDAGQPMSPHFVLTATRRHDLFRLRLRFDPCRSPHWVRRVNGEPVRRLDVPRPAGELLELDGAGEVATEFHRPTPYLAYGIQFWPPRHEC